MVLTTQASQARMVKMGFVSVEGAEYSALITLFTGFEDIGASTRTKAECTNLSAFACGLRWFCGVCGVWFLPLVALYTPPTTAQTSIGR